MNLHERSSGVLLHISSLPGAPYCGDLGRGSRAFVDLLVQSGQRWWQTLPVNPIDYFFSPYASFSSFAGEPLYLCLEQLVEDGLLDRSDLTERGNGNPEKTDFNSAREYRSPRWKKAFARYRDRKGEPYRDQYEKFMEGNAWWVEPHGMFCALLERFGVRDWMNWPDEKIRKRDPEALRAVAKELEEEIDYYIFLQLVFEIQWNRLREYTQQQGIGLIGDLPIYVSQSSVETWASPEMFEIDENGHPLRVAGVPGDAFNPNGQRWDSPLYRWEVHREDGYHWWMNRIGLSLHRYDALRLDHFIGFHNFYSIPADAESPLEGEWHQGPGEDFFRKVFEQYPGAQLIAEDLGDVSEGVIALRDQFDLPGLSVLQFAFDYQHEGDPTEKWPQNTLVCSGTHDTNTLMGWYDQTMTQDQDALPFSREYMLGILKKYLPEEGVPRLPTHSKCPEAEREDLRRSVGHQAMLQMVLQSKGNLSIFQMQDLLGLDQSGRMNYPGEAEGNWTWRLREGWTDPGWIDSFRELTHRADRLAR